jgi:hypothetical protein
MESTTKVTSLMISLTAKELTITMMEQSTREIFKTHAHMETALRNTLTEVRLKAISTKARNLRENFSGQMAHAISVISLKI